MFFNILLSLVIILELLGIPKAQEKILGSNFKSGEKKKVLGIQSLPRVDLKKIPSLSVKSKDDKINTTAQSAMVIDLKTNKILYQKEPSQILSIASLTKMMSALVILENFNINEIVAVSAQAAWQPGSKMHLLPGEQIRVSQVIYGMLIASGNDAASAVEEHFGKNRLVDLMNKKAQFLGLKNTKFADAIGLDPENKSTSKDMLILARYILKNPKIAEIIKQKEYTAVSVDGQNQHLIHTTNRLLKQYSDIFGVKTGYTEEAGNCLVAGASQNEHYVLSIVLGISNNTARFVESRNLIDWAFQNHQW